jgi:tight adherence protein B
MEKIYANPKNYFEYEFSKQELRYYYAGSIALLFVLGYLFYSNIFLSICLSLTSIYFSKAYKKYMLLKRRRDLNFQFRDLLFSISSSISSGRQMLEAIKDSREPLNMIYSENDYINIEVNKIYNRLTNSKESLETVLIEFSKKCRIEDITNFVDIYLTCRHTGGDINKVIMKTCSLIMDKINMQKELETLTANKKLEGKILVLIPIVTLLLLKFFSPDYIAVLYATSIGKVIMTFALLGILSSYLLILKITQIDF